MRNFYFLPATAVFKNAGWLKNRGIPAFLLITSLLFINTLAAQPGVQWEYSRAVNFAPTPLANFQIKIELNGAAEHAHMNSNGGDLRFYAGTTVECSYWIETFKPAGKSVIWVKVPASGTSALAMYYGNPMATTTASGENTFDFFDGFEGTVLSPKWVNNSSEVQPGTITVDGGEVNLENKGNITSMYAKYDTASLPDSYIIELKHKENGYFRNRFYVTDTMRNDYKTITGPDYGLWSNTTYGNNTGYVQWGGGAVYANTDYLMKWEIIKTTGYYEWSNHNYLAGNQISTANRILPGATFINISVTEETYQSTIIDWVRIRKAGTEITGTIDVETVRVSVPVISTVSSLTGCQGETFTITGNFPTNFGRTVKIGGVVMEIVTENATSITAKFGTVSGNLSGNLSVTTSAGVSIQAFAMTATALPVVTAGNALPFICSQGISAALGGTVTGGTAIWSVNVTGGTFNVSGDFTTTTWTAPTGFSGTATFTLTGTQGACTATATKTLTVNATPTGTVMVSGDKDFCVGESITFTAPSGYTGYEFLITQGANTATINNAGNPVYSATNLQPGATVKVKVTNSGCIATLDTESFTVNAIPSGLFTSTENSGNTPNDGIICMGGVINFAFSNTSFTNYKFLLNGVTVLKEGNQSYLLNQTNLVNGDKITVEVTGPGGCTKLFGPITVAVRNNPVGSLTSDKPGDAICLGGSLTFSASSGFVNYEFFLNGDETLQGPSPTRTLTYGSGLINNDEISVRVKNSNGCFASIDTVKVTVNDLPSKPTIEYGSQATEFCVGDGDITLSVNVTPDPAYKYQWFRNGAFYGSLGTNHSLNLTLVAESGSYAVSFVNENGCFSPVSDPVVVNIFPVAPKPTVTASGLVEFCEGGSVTLTSSSASSYQWYFGTTTGNLAPISGQTNQTITLTEVNQTGYYAVGITNANGCAGVAQSTPMLVTVNALPVTPEITISNGNLTYCVGENVTLSAPTANGYRWYKDGVLITSGTGQNYTTAKTLAAAGVYTVEIKNLKCWSGISEGTIVTVNPLPEPTIIGPATICLGTTGNEYSTEAGMNNYVWTPTGGTITSGTGTNTILIDWPGTGSGKSLDVKYTDDKGCTSTKKATFANSPLVKPVISGVQEVCVGSTEVEYTTEAGKSDYDWAISAGGAITSGATTNSIKVTWTGAGPQTVSVNYTNADNCNAPTPTVWPVTVNPVPIAEFSYSATPYCSNSGNISPLMATGATKGIFSFSPTGSNLIINPSSGMINTSSSDPGTYTITNTIASAGGCSIITATSQITITELPTADISYVGTPFCSDDNEDKTVTRSGTGAFVGGDYTAPSGLSIALNSGAINPSLSTVGSYIVTYTIPATAGCPKVVVTTATPAPVVITALPTITLSYTNTEYCKSDNELKSPSLTGSTGSYNGGNYTASPLGLNINATTGSFTPALSAPGVYTITYTIPASAGCREVSKETTVIITEVPSALIAYTATPYCQTETTVEVVREGHAAYEGGIYSSTNGLSIDPSSGIINPSASTAGTYIVTYTIPASGGCAAVPVTTSVTISPKPEVNAGEDWATCVGEGPVNITQGADTTYASSILWTGGAGTWSQANSLTQATYEPLAGETGDITLTLTATGINGCSAITSTATKTLTINSIPEPVYIVPENAPALCVGGIQSFISVKNKVSDFTSGPILSSTASVAIPDNLTAGVFKNISVSGIPSDAVITSVDIEFNVPHTSDGDLTINLKAPNGKVLNIANALSGPGFTNTIISSAATNPIQTSGDIGPFTGTYAAQMRYGTQGATSVSGNRAFAKSFDELFSNPNGNWILSVRDGGAGDEGKFNSWSITVKYSIPIDPIPVLWTQSDTIPGDLYLDASATSPYTGDARSVVYAKPIKVGAHQYTASSIASTGCKSTKEVTLNISPSPKVYIKADYCENAQDGKITLEALGVDNPASYSWSTGETTASVLVDIAHEYYVSVTNLEGCTGTGILSVAEELVINGDFEQENVGFYTEYINKPSPNPPHPFQPDHSGLVDEGTYAVDTSAYVYHLQFHGRDHTTSEQKGRFMIVNGLSDIVSNGKYPTPHIRIIWEQTVSVLPNTDYYFSAWAMNFSGTSGTRLQFEVNGEPVGTIADLSTIPAPGSEEHINISNWVRFYNGNTSGVDDTWNSGGNTEAVIRIVNLNPAASGNDFGLDDISFGTLAPFVSGPDVSGRDEQTICVGESIQPIVYKVGSGDEPIDGLPVVFDNEFDGLYYTISGGALAVPGVYEYVLETTGSCPIPATATGKITVLPNPVITLTSITTDAALCLNSNLPAPITFNVIGAANDAVFTGLPTGITGVYNSSDSTASISGSSSVTGSFNYKLKTQGICKADSLSGVISVDALPEAGTITSPAICLNEDGVIKVTGFTGDILGWSSSEDGTIYTPIVNNITDSVAFTNITQNTYYKVQVGNGVCTAVYSEAVAVSIQNLWQGKLSSDWDNPFNWASGSMPVLTTAVCGGTVTIPQVSNTNSDPVLTVTAAVTNLSVLSGGNLTINTGGNLQIAGNVTSAGIINARNGGIEYISSMTRSIEPDIFLDNAIGDLKINNRNKGVILNAPIDIYGSLTFGTDPQTLITNDNLTLKSTKEQTASLGNMTGQTITGKATVERYINTGLAAHGGHGKSWQLLATPTVGQTIKESWMEGAVSNGSTPIQNPKPGYGTLLNTGHNNVPANGYDLYTSAGTSIKQFNPVTGAYDGGPLSTNDPIYDPKGYMVLVRGDRSVYTSSAQAIPTILRTKGTFITGPQSVNIPANSFGSVGNPYASAVSIADINKSGGVDEFIYVWDPLLTGSYGLGGIVTLNETGGGVYSATPSTGSYSGPVTQIQSGQAFFVQTTGSAGTVGFTEASKTSGSAMVMRPFGSADRTAQLKTNLFGLASNGGSFISDGNLVQFGADYSNEIDGKDARKISNTSENLGIVSNNKLLAIERRQPVMTTDTLFFNLTGVRVQNYRFELLAKGLEQEGLTGFLEDTYLGTKTPLNLEGSTLVDFKIENKPGSYAARRFRVVFKAALGPLPVTLLDLQAAQNADEIVVKWKVENQVNIRKYEIEKSLDGTHFSAIGELPAGNSDHYSWLDKQIEPGFNYYRLRSVDENGKNALSAVVKVLVQTEPSDITIYPNPISNGVMNVHLVNQPSGKYKIKLLNPVGQVMINKQINHLQGNSTEKITWDYKMARGMYQLEVTKPDGGIKIIKVIY